MFVGNSELGYDEEFTNGRQYEVMSNRHETVHNYTSHDDTNPSDLY